jgi:hypothetical protein
MIWPSWFFPDEGRTRSSIPNDSDWFALKLWYWGNRRRGVVPWIEAL